MAINRTDRLQGTGHLRPQAAGTRPLQAEPAQLEATRQAGTDRLVRREPNEAVTQGLTLAQGAVAALTGSAAYVMVRNTLSVKKKIEDIQRFTSHLDLRGLPVGAVRDRLVNGARNFAEQSMNKPLDPLKKLGKLERVGEGMRVVSGIDAALKFPGTLMKLRDGATLPELADVGSKGLNIVRGADSAIKVIKGVRGGFIPMKMAPGISAVAGAFETVHRGNKLINEWGTMPANQKIANMAYMASGIADMIGVIPVAYPFTKVISAGLSLVGMAAENWGTIKKVGGTVLNAVGEAFKRGPAGLVAVAAPAVGEAIGGAVSAVKETGKTLLDGAKKLFGGL